MSQDYPWTVWVLVQKYSQLFISHALYFPKIWVGSSRCCVILHRSLIFSAFQSFQQ
jgi:hypothetical protein